MRVGWQQHAADRLRSHWLLKAAGIAVYMTAFMCVYFALLRHPQFPVTTMPLQPLDRVIGFQPWALIPYASLWLYIALVPSLLYLRGEMASYLSAVTILGVIGCAIFLFWPTTVPTFNIDWVGHSSVAFLKSVDAAGNACPSLHVAFSVLTASWLGRLLRRMNAPGHLHIVNFAWCGLIVWSTMATKQHVAWDVETGALLGGAVALFHLAGPGRLWRALGTGLCFVVYGTASWLAGMTILPIVWLWPGTREARQRRIRRLTGASFRWLLAVIAALRLGYVELEGREWLVEADGKLIVATHPMYLDVVALIGLLPLADCVVKHAMWRNPLYRRFVRVIGYISNASGAGLMDDCVDSLKRGRTLILFPEGTRSEPGKPLHFRRGAAQVAVRSGCDILPIVIRCEPLALGKGQTWHAVSDRPWRLSIRVFPPQSVAALGCNGDLPPGVAARRVTRNLEAFFARQLASDDRADQPLGATRRQFQGEAG